MHLMQDLSTFYTSRIIMRTEINVLTGETTEHEDAPVTWEVPVEVAPTPPTKEELLAKLQEIQAQINSLGA
jgi:hypothetical protein